MKHLLFYILLAAGIFTTVHLLYTTGEVGRVNAEYYEAQQTLSDIDLMRYEIAGVDKGELRFNNPASYEVRQLKLQIYELTK